MGRLALVAFLVMSLWLGLVPAASAQAEGCQFVLGFAELHDRLPQIVGDCVTNEYHNPENGDGLQETSGGLLVWRKADNVMAFTNGVHTWVSGPAGLQQRPNDQRFPWEWNPDRLPVSPKPRAGERCHTGGLSLRVHTVDNGNGRHTALFGFTNHLDVPCTLAGTVGAEMLDGQNNPLPTSVTTAEGGLTGLPGESAIVLPAGGSAVFSVSWQDTPVEGEPVCPAASRLKVTPPGEFGAIIVSLEITACDSGLLGVSAVAPSISLSHNWSGYVSTGGAFTSVTGTWVVPAAGESGGLSGSAAWVGIGGADSEDLIQAGTAAVSRDGGPVEHIAWVETLPQPVRPIDLSISPGDSITVTITQWGAEQWMISLTNNSTGQNYQGTEYYTSSMSSAEWVMEAPTHLEQGIVPLSNFGTVQFSDCSAVKDGQRVSIAQAGSYPVTMLDADGRIIASTSPLSATGNGFSVSRAAP